MSILCRLGIHDWDEFRYSNAAFHNRGRVCLRCGRFETKLDGEWEDYHLSGYIDDLEKYRAAVRRKKRQEIDASNSFKERAANTMHNADSIIEIMEKGWEK